MQTINKDIQLSLVVSAIFENIICGLRKKAIRMLTVKTALQVQITPKFKLCLHIGLRSNHGGKVLVLGGAPVYSVVTLSKRCLATDGALMHENDGTCTWEHGTGDGDDCPTAAVAMTEHSGRQP